MLGTTTDATGTHGVQASATCRAGSGTASDGGAASCRTDGSSLIVKVVNYANAAQQVGGHTSRSCSSLFWGDLVEQKSCRSLLALFAGKQGLQQPSKGTYKMFVRYLDGLPN